MIQVELDGLESGQLALRDDMGDLDGLAESMKSDEQWYPIIIGRDGKILDGSRRVAAARMLGWESIQARRASTASGELYAARIEIGANDLRKPLTQKEKLQRAIALRPLEAEAAAERKRAGASRGGSSSGATAPELEKRASTYIGEAIGTSGDTAKRILRVAKIKTGEYDGPADIDALREKVLAPFEAGNMSPRGADDVITEMERSARERIDTETGEVTTEPAMSYSEKRKASRAEEAAERRALNQERKDFVGNTNQILVMLSVAHRWWLCWLVRGCRRGRLPPS